MKKPGWLDEFKVFISRGNVIDLAVGVIIGGAFQSIVKSLVDDIFMPIISLATKGIDFSNWFIALDGNKYGTLAQAQEAGAAVISYGNFISAVINFIIMAFIISLVAESSADHSLSSLAEYLKVTLVSLVLAALVTSTMTWPAILYRSSSDGSSSSAATFS